jgi:hypothetical protein
MFLKFEALIGTVTMTGSVSGKRNEWSVSVTGPGGVTKTDETVEKDWSPLLNEMLAAAHDDAICRRFPERAALAASGGKR